MPLNSTESARDQYVATVAANVHVCREHFRLVLRLPHFPATEPGQFVQLLCAATDDEDPRSDEIEWRPGDRLQFSGAELTGPVAVLRRPFSLAGRQDTAVGVELYIIHRVVGVGTTWLAGLRPGDAVNVLGPLGNRFTLPPPRGTALLVGGGVGIPPMLYLAEKFAGQPEGRTAVVFSGALSRDLLPLTINPAVDAPGPESFEPIPCIDEFSRHGVPAVISTDDGSFGFRGYITQALERYLDRCSPQAAAPVIYTCGPEPMMKCVADIANHRGIECQVAVERAMACGMGTCQSCCIRLKRDPQRDGRGFAGKDWIYKLACTDGPVFKAADLLW